MRLIALLLGAAHALLHPNGLLEVRIDRGCVLSGLPGLEKALRVAQTDSGVTGLLLMLQDASAQTEDDHAVLARVEGPARLALLRREYEALEAMRSSREICPSSLQASGHMCKKSREPTVCRSLRLIASSSRELARAAGNQARASVHCTRKQPSFLVEPLTFLQVPENSQTRRPLSSLPLHSACAQNARPSSSMAAG